MNHLLTTLPQRLGELALQATLWLTLGMALALAAKTRPTLRKHLLACTLGGLLVLSLLMLLPAPRWQLADLWPSFGTSSAAANATPTDLTTTITYGAPTENVLVRLPLIGRLFAPHEAAPPVTAQKGKEQFGWPLLVCAVALVAAGFYLLRLVASLWALRRLRLESQPLACSHTLTLVEDLARRLGLSRLPDLRVHPRLAVPGTFGWWRPVILLPADWQRWNHDELRCVLAHELAHLRAGDFRLSLLAQFGRAVHGYHPLAHFVSRQLLNQLELLADQLAATAVGGTAAYARNLCRLALRPRRPVPQPPALAFWPAALPLSWRMTMLTKTKKSPRPLGWGRRLSLASVLLLGLALIAGLRSPATATADPPAQAEAKASSPQANVQVEASPYETRYCRADAHGVWCIRPAQILALPSMKPIQSQFDAMLQEVGSSLLGRQLPDWSLADVEQVVTSVHLKAKTAGEMGQLNASLDFVRLVPGKRWADLIAAAFPDLKPTLHEGKPYYAVPLVLQPVLGDGVHKVFIGLIDERSLVVGSEEQVKAALAGKAAPLQFRWNAEAWSKVSHGPLVAAFDLDAVRKVIDATGDDVQAGQLKKYAAVWRNADSLVLGMLPQDELGIILQAAAAPGQQLTIDRAFVEAQRAALNDLISNLSDTPVEQVANLQPFTQSGAVGLGMVLKAQHLTIGLSVPVKLGDILKAKQSPAPIPPAEELGSAHFEIDLQVIEAPRDVVLAASVEAFKPARKRLNEPVPSGPNQAYLPSGWGLLTSHEVTKLKSALLADKRAQLLSCPKLKCLEKAPAAVSVGTSPEEAKLREMTREEQKVVLTVTPRLGKEPGEIELAISNCFDVGDGAVVHGHPQDQPEVRRQATVPEGQSLLLVIPSVKPDGKVQLVVATPKVVAADAVGDVGFQLMLGTVDDAGARELAPHFTPMETPAGPHPIAALYEKNQAEFGQELARLRQAGHIKLMAVPQLAATMGQSVDFRCVQAPKKATRIGVVPRRWRGPDLLEFELFSEFDMVPERGEKQLNKQTLVGRLGTNYVQLERRSDGKGWWLVGARPVRIGVMAPAVSPPLAPEAVAR